MLDFNSLLALATILLVAVTWLTDYFQWRSIRNVDRFLKDSRDIGTQIGEWMLESEGEGKPTNLQIMAGQTGQVIASSFKMGLNGIASGEARQLRSVEAKVMNALQTPEAKALMEFCDRAGIPQELAGIVYEVAEKRGYLSKIFENNGSGSSSGGNNGTWGR